VQGGRRRRRRRRDVFLLCEEKQILIRHLFKERKVFCLIVTFLYKREAPEEEEKEKRDLESLSKHL
jgi:hypothetical protein